MFDPFVFNSADNTAGLTAELEGQSLVIDIMEDNPPVPGITKIALDMASVIQFHAYLEKIIHAQIAKDFDHV